MDTVIRYVPTYVNQDGMRTLMRPAQGRHTFETPDAAQEWLDAVTANTSVDTIRQLWGNNPRFAVRSCPCRPGHFDPQTIWFDDTLADTRDADRIDGYDRDDLGESPDW